MSSDKHHHRPAHAQDSRLFHHDPPHENGSRFHHELHNLPHEEHRASWQKSRLHGNNKLHDLHIFDGAPAKSQHHGHDHVHDHGHLVKPAEIHAIRKSESTKPVEESRKPTERTAAPALPKPDNAVAEVAKPNPLKIDPSTVERPPGMPPIFQSSQAPSEVAGPVTPTAKSVPEVKAPEALAGKVAVPTDVKSAAPPSLGLADRVSKVVQSNEGDFTTFVRNDNHHGLSVGIRQWNQRGELPNLLKQWHEKNPAKFDETFGKYAKHLLNERWVNHAHLGYNKNFMSKMQTALRDPEFQQVQTDKAREFAQQSVDHAKKLGLKSELGAALVADFKNQMGPSGSRRAFKRAGLHEGAEVKDESAILARLGKLTRRPNGKERLQELLSNFSPQRLIDSMPHSGT